MPQRFAAFGLEPQKFGEGSEILEPAVLLGEGLHDHRGAVRLEARGFEHGGGSPVEQLVADMLDGANGQPDQVADEGDPFGLARAGTDHPFSDGRAEGFIDLGFDRDGDRLILGAGEGEYIALALSAPAGQGYLVLGSREKQLGVRAEHCSDFRRKTLRRLPRKGRGHRRIAAPPLLLRVGEELLPIVWAAAWYQDLDHTLDLNSFGLM